MQHPLLRSIVDSPTFTSFDGSAGRTLPDILAIAADSTRPAVVRATALGRMAAAGAGTMVDSWFRDPNVMVRRGALDVLRHADEATRLRLAPPLLSDPIRTVRIEAVQALMDVGVVMKARRLASWTQAFAPGQITRR